jgi:SPP1 family predicted phage head-tail adaptor
MRAGTLRHRVTIEALVTTIDENTGAQSEAWVVFGPLAGIWAEIVPLSGREFLAAAAQQAGVNTRITIRHREGIEPSMRVLHGEDVYNVKAVLPDPTLRRHVTLMCERGVNQG